MRSLPRPGGQAGAQDRRAARGCLCHARGPCTQCCLDGPTAIWSWYGSARRAPCTASLCHMCRMRTALPCSARPACRRIKSSLTGIAVEHLHKALPGARIVYSSATGASEPVNIRYMMRLGHEGFSSRGDLIFLLKK